MADSWELIDPYFEGRCGGSDNQDCLREGLAAFQDNWDTTLAEIVALASSTETLIRPIAIRGVSPNIRRQYGSRGDEFNAFESNTEAMWDHMVQSCEEYGIPVTDGRSIQEPQYFSLNGIFPNEEGVAVLVELLHDLGYEYGQ